MNLYFAPAGMI